MKIIKRNNRLQTTYSHIIKKNMSIIYGIILIFIYLTFIGCECKPLKLPIDATFKEKAFNDFSSSFLKQKSPETINIFVDISYSNAGFISSDNSDFLNCIRSLCAILDTNLTIKFFSFGSEIKLLGSRNPGKEKSVRISKLLDFLEDENNYKDSETRFDYLFRLLEKNKNLNELNLVFTDGIHSEKGNTENVFVELTNYIRKFVKENNLFGILGRKGQYNGIYYTESSCPNIPEYNGLRPFYCFIFGSRTHIDFLKTHFMQYWQKHFLLYPASFKEIHIDKKKINVGFDEHLINDGVIILNNVKNTSSFSIPITLRSDDFRFWNLKKVTANLDMKNIEIYHGCNKKKESIVIKDEKHWIDCSTNILGFDGKNELSLEVRFKPINSPGLCIYKITITPELPDWIKEWSTETDCTHEDAQKTYGLKNFTRNLLTVTSDSQFEFINIYFVESRR